MLCCEGNIIREMRNMIEEPVAPSSDASGWLARHGDALYRYARLRLRSSHAAEDVVQETLLAALGTSSRPEAFAGRSSELTWLIGILRHKVVDSLRRASRESPPPEDAALPAWEAFFQKQGKWHRKPSIWRGRGANDPHAHLERAEFRTILVHCLERMPRRLAKVFMLREADEVSSDEICEVFDISAANLWTLLHRARTRLRDCLGVNGFNERPPNAPARAKGRE